MLNYQVMIPMLLASFFTYKGSDNIYYAGAVFMAGWALATAVNMILGWLYFNLNDAYLSLTVQMQGVLRRLPAPPDTDKEAEELTKQQEHSTVTE